MKPIILFFSILFSSSAIAQITMCPPAVQYFYDDAGNRINRQPYGPCKTDGTDTVTTNSGSQLSQLKDNSNLPLSEQEGFNINVYPNPTQNYLQVAAEHGFMGLDNKLAIVYSLKGELVNQQSIMSNNFSLDFTGYAPGYYIVRVLADGYNKEWKIEKQ